MRSRLMLLLVTFLTLSLGLPMSAYAETSDDAEVNVNIPEILYLYVHGEPMNWNVTTTNGPGWYNQGFTNSKSVVCRIWANCNWQLSVRGEDQYFTNTGAGSWDSKPREDIQWHDGIPTWTSLTGTWATVDTGSAGNWDDDPDDYGINVTFKVLLDWADDKPGTYNYTVFFTLNPT